jgi:hypothetical protein
VLLNVLAFVELVSLYDSSISISSLEAVDHEVVNQDSKTHIEETLEDA